MVTTISPLRRRAALLSFAMLTMALVGCEQRFSTSFRLMPGSVAQFSAEGDRAFGVIRNHGPSSMVATFAAEGSAPKVHDIKPNQTVGEAMNKRSVTIVGGAGDSLIDIEVQNATSFTLDLAPQQ